MTRKVVSSTRSTVVFLLFFFRKPTQAHTSGFSHQSKIYRRCADKMPLYSWEVHVRFHCHLNFTEAEGWRKKEIGTKGGGGAMVKKKEN